MRLAELLPEHVLGSLGAEEAAELEQALVSSPGLRAEHDELAAVAALLALAAPPIAPSDAARARLLAAVEGEGRYAPFVERLGALFDLGRARVQALLASMTDPAAWSVGPAEGIRLMHFDAGPAALAFDAGFVRVPQGAEFPTHRHTGREVVLVLEGSYVELGSGIVVRAGELAERAAGSSHGFRALEGSDLVFGVVLGGAIEIGDEPYVG